MRASAAVGREVVPGPGGNFGIVTEFELEAYHVPDVVFAQMAFEASDPASLLDRWGKLVEAAPRELTSFLYLSRGVAQTMTVYADDDTDAAVAALTPLLSVAPVLQQQAQLVRMPRSSRPPTRRTTAGRTIR
jgi:hypothetical protein